MKKIFIVEDDKSICMELVEILENEGYAVSYLTDFEHSKEEILAARADLILMDINIPGINGRNLLKEIRKESDIPVIMVTSRTSEMDEVLSMSYGADDYITKPFSLKNLSARVQAVLRRSTEDLVPLARQFSWNQGDLVIDYDRKEVRKKGEPVALTAIEWKLLAAFTKYPQKIFTRENLIELVFGLDFSGYDRVIDTHIKNLRKKIEDDSKQPVYLCTVHGMGYKFGGTAE